MRTEELINEAKGYSRENSAYIHCEMFNGKSGAAIVTGDDKAIMAALYGILETLADQNANGDPVGRKRELTNYIKLFKRLHKKSLSLGRTVFREINKIGEKEADK